MNLNKLFTPQKELDEHILNEKGLHGQDLLKKKTVALICELYEMANEGRWFKFWSDDQKPRTRVLIECSLCNGSGDENNEPNIESLMEEKGSVPYKACSECNETGIQGYKNPLLEEYADIIHFTISIANDIGYTEHKYIETDHTDLNDLVIGITNIATIVPLSREHKHMRSLMNSVIQLGYQLGFDEEQVIDAYFDKNKENHIRQESGY